MSEDMQKIIACMQEAVDAEMERKAKLGYKAVIADKNDRPKIVSAKYLVRKRRDQKKAEAAVSWLDLFRKVGLFCAPSFHSP